MVTERRINPRFAVCLRQAIGDSGLTLDDVQRRLHELGTPVGRSTLSYWQNGRRLPSGARSHTVVRALESLLGVRPGTLLEALLAPGPLDTVDQLTGSVAQSSTGDRVGALIEEVGCAASFSSIEMIAAQDFALIGAGGGLEQVSTILTFRALTEIDRWPAVHGGEAGGDPRQIRCEPVSGARLGRVRYDDQANIVVSELVFDRMLRRGEHHIVRRITYDRNPTQTREAMLFSGLVRAMVSLEVSFHPDRVPVHIEEFEHSPETGTDRYQRPVVIGPDRRTSLVRERSRPGMIGLRWTYAG